MGYITPINSIKPLALFNLLNSDPLHLIPLKYSPQQLLHKQRHILRPLNLAIYYVLKNVQCRLALEGIEPTDQFADKHAPRPHIGWVRVA